MKIIQKSIDRMQNILKHDKDQVSLPFLNMIKSDIYCVLNGYLNIFPEDINIKYYIEDNGLYNFDIKLRANNIKNIKFFNV